MFKLIFAGELITGFEQPAVEENLAELLKQSPAEVRQKLFNGKTVVIKRVDSEAIARKWQQAFARAGAVLVINEHSEAAEKPAPEQQPAEPNSPVTREAPSEEPSIASARARAKAAGPRNRAYLWLGLIALILIVVTVSLLWLTRPLWQSAQLPEHQRDLANALSMEGIYALGHVNVTRVNALESLAGSETDLHSLPGGDGFWDSLAAAGVHPRRDIEHLWLAGFYSEGNPAAVMVASGSFDVARLSEWLAERYTVQSQSDQGIVFTRLNENTCQPGTPLLAHISQNQLVMGEPAKVAAVLERMQSGAAAAVDLSRWESVSSGQIATLAILVPENIGRGIGGMSGMMVQGIGRAAGPAEGLYIGADTVALPPGIELSLLVASNDQAFNEQTYTAIDSRLGEMRAEAQQSWPQLVSLYDRLSVQKRDDGVRAAARFDQHLKRDIGNWVNAFVGSMFASPGSDPGEESIDEDPPVFTQAASTSLPNYSDYRQIPQHFFTPALEVGPFALGVNSLEVDDDGKIAIKITAEAYDLPNLPSRGAAVKFAIESVVDAEGQSLLAEVECGPDKNSEPADIGNVMASSYYGQNSESIEYVKLSGDKTLSLPAGVTVSDIAEIRGTITYAQTVALERKVLQSPLAGQSVEAHGVKVSFLGDDAHSLRYQISGDTDRLLYIYARNQSGQPLNSSSSMRGGSLFGNGKTYTVNYRGTIASVELVIAREQQLHNFPFVLDSVYPAARSLDNIYPQPALFDSQQWPAFAASTAPDVSYNWNAPEHELDTGPLRVAVTDLDTGGSFGFSFSADIYAHSQFALNSGLASGELRITQLQQADGNLHDTDLSAFFAFTHDGGYWMNGVYQPDEERPWLKGSASVRERDLAVPDTTHIHGQVKVKMATSVDAHKLPFAFAMQWQDSDLSLKVSKWESGKLSMSYDGDLSKLVAVKAYRGDELISQPAAVQQMFGDASIVLEIDGVPTHLHFDIANEFVHEDFPFVLDLSVEP